MKEPIEITIELYINDYPTTVIFHPESGKPSRKATVRDGDRLRIDVDVELKPMQSEAEITKEY
jgi:hypothetical protein